MTIGGIPGQYLTVRTGLVKSYKFNALRCSRLFRTLLMLKCVHLTTSDQFVSRFTSSVFFKKFSQITRPFLGTADTSLLDFW